MSKPDERTFSATFKADTPELFESRKADHIRLSLDDKTQAAGLSGLESVRLIHEALPDLNFEEISLDVDFLGRPVCSPMFISSMTAGHAGSLNLNLVMARVAAARGWPMAVGSQRKELSKPEAGVEWKLIRRDCPRIRFLGNIGIAQVITEPVDDIKKLVDNLEADALFVHLNSLQECLQPEGTPRFKGSLKALEHLVEKIGVPVIVKETGCGFSMSTLERLRGIGLHAVDVSGLGGTHWGRVEGGRSEPHELRARVAETFRDWGIGTVSSLIGALELDLDFEIWASGGVRSGLDAAKLVAMGAKHVGLAQPILRAAVNGEEALDQALATFEYEMRTALFCTGADSIESFRSMKVWDLV